MDLEREREREKERERERPSWRSWLIPSLGKRKAQTGVLVETEYLGDEKSSNSDSLSYSSTAYSPISLYV